eukprot:scaffold156438_cov24-Tisochrysis_lutea.AAC.1
MPGSAKSEERHFAVLQPYLTKARVCCSELTSCVPVDRRASRHRPGYGLISSHSTGRELGTRLARATCGG